MNKLELTIHNVKSISDFSMDFPLKKGLYALTGENGTGKSTIMTCAASVFYQMPLEDYFGDTPEDARISFRVGDKAGSWEKVNKKWTKITNGKVPLKGFFEGSIIYGNRFKDTSKDSIEKLIQAYQTEKLHSANPFIIENLGYVLHNSKSAYPGLYELSHTSSKKYSFNGRPFYLKVGNKTVIQAHMSTGENLLITILHSLEKRINDRRSIRRGDWQPTVILLDEIELALHPAALQRLLELLGRIAQEYDFSIYFSTHSIELIRGINPDNIFYLEKHQDNSIELITPCYPAYATKNLYETNYGYDIVIFVEDVLAVEIVQRILVENKMKSNKLIAVIPCGGWRNVLSLHEHFINNNLFAKPTKFITILDGDVQTDASKYLNDKTKDLLVSYLPIKSLEKYLKFSLCDVVDHKLFRELSDYIFYKNSLGALVRDYNTLKQNLKDDSTGKRFFGLIVEELHNCGKSKETLVEFVVKYVIEQNGADVQRIKEFLVANI